MRQQKTQNQQEARNEKEVMFQVTRIYKMDTDSPLKAFVDITVCNAILIKGIRLLSNKEGGLFVSMPSEKAKDNKFYDTVKLLAAESKQVLHDAILAAYNS